MRHDEEEEQEEVACVSEGEHVRGRETLMSALLHAPPAPLLASATLSLSCTIITSHTCPPSFVTCLFGYTTAASLLRAYSCSLPLMGLLLQPPSYGPTTAASLLRAYYCSLPLKGRLLQALKGLLPQLPSLFRHMSIQ